MSSANAQSARPGTTLAMSTSFVIATRIPIRKTSIMLQGWMRRSSRNMRRQLPRHAVRGAAAAARRAGARSARSGASTAVEPTSDGDLRHALLVEVEDARWRASSGVTCPFISNERNGNDVGDDEEDARPRARARACARSRCGGAGAARRRSARQTAVAPSGTSTRAWQQIAVVAGDDGHDSARRQLAIGRGADVFPFGGT